MRDLYNWFVSSLFIIRDNRTRNKVRLVLIYGKIRFKNLFCRIFSIKLKTENFMGFQVHFLDYSTFTYLFEEIFIRQIYHFTADSHQPQIIDAGANIGMALLYFKSLYPNSYIYAIEADPDIFALLEKNVQINSLRFVELIPKALSDQIGTLEFHKAKDKSLIGSITKTADFTVKVDTLPLSQILNSNVDLIKMDIEGSEFPVLEEIDKANRWHLIQQLILECHHQANPQYQTSSIVALLEKNKFKFHFGTYQLLSANYQKQQDLMIYAQKN